MHFSLDGVYTPLLHATTTSNWTISKSLYVRPRLSSLTAGGLLFTTFHYVPSISEDKSLARPTSAVYIDDVSGYQQQVDAHLTLTVDAQPHIVNSTTGPRRLRIPPAACYSAHRKNGINV